MQAIKSTIINQFPQFSSIKKVADVQAVVDGQTVRVIIKKGEAQKVKLDQKVVWDHTDGDILDFIQSLISPVIEEPVIEEPKSRSKAQLIGRDRARNRGHISLIKRRQSAKAEVVKAEVVEPKIEKEVAEMAPTKTKEAKVGARVSVTPEWIAHLESVAQQVPSLREGHNIVIRVATNYGKPVTACIDIYKDDKKLASGGRPHKINFATSGIDEAWMTRTNEASKAAYIKIDAKADKVRAKKLAIADKAAARLKVAQAAADKAAAEAAE